MSDRWWTKSCNPVIGCAKVSAGCRHCWAERMAKRFMGGRYAAVVNWRGWRHESVWVEEAATRLATFRKGRIFVSDMGDFFHDAKAAGPRLVAVLDRIALGIEHKSTARFFILTKRPKVMRDAVRYAESRIGTDDRHEHYELALRDRLWLGVSVEDASVCSTRIEELQGLCHTFVSCEPLIGSIRGIGKYLVESDVLWVQVGAETGYGHRPCLDEWAAEIVGEASDAGIPVFVKKLVVGGEPTAAMHRWPSWARRREYPASILDPEE